MPPVSEAVHVGMSLQAVFFVLTLVLLIYKRGTKNNGK